MLVPLLLYLAWLWFVYVDVVEWVCVFHMCESFQFEGRVMQWLCDSTFISGTVSVLLCNEALGTSSSLAVEGEAVSVGF